MRTQAVEPPLPSPLLRRQQGVSLVEVMIAVIVVSLGMIGVLGAHSRGFSNTSSAGYRTQATLLAGGIVERARANLGNDYSIAMGAATGGNGQAANDLATWKTQLARAMPDGDGSVEIATVVDPGTGALVRQMRVLVRWDDRRASGEGGAAGAAQYKFFMTETYLP
jgi:type IV pilus assembly protein PilV